jgi:hypothetical protein
MMPFLLSDFSLVQFGLYVEHVECPVNTRLKNVFLFSQIFLDFPFKIIAVCGR